MAVPGCRRAEVVREGKGWERSGTGSRAAGANGCSPRARLGSHTVTPIVACAAPTLKPQQRSRSSHAAGGNSGIQGTRGWPGVRACSSVRAVCVCVSSPRCRFDFHRRSSKKLKSGGKIYLSLLPRELFPRAFDISTASSAPSIATNPYCGSCSASVRYVSEPN